MRPGVSIKLADADRERLDAIVLNRNSLQKQVWRARIALLIAAGASVDEAVLRERGLVRGPIDGVKILARGELSKKLTLEVDAVTDAARLKIENAGGTIVIREKRAKAEEAAAA